MAVLGATLVWMFASNIAGASNAVLVLSPIAPGESIPSSALGIIEVRGELPEGTLSSTEQLQRVFANKNLMPGTLLNVQDITASRSADTYLQASLPLEAGDETQYRPGSSVRVWVIKEEGSFLVTDNAIVLLTQAGVGANSRVVLKFDPAVEFELMQAYAVRLVLNQA